MTGDSNASGLQATAPAQRLASFAVLLREHGLNVGIAEQQTMLKILLLVGVTQEKTLQAAWRAIACHSQREWRQWQDIYQRFWHPESVRGSVKVSGQTKSSRSLQQQVQAMHDDMESAQQPSAAKSAAQSAGEVPGFDQHNNGLGDSSERAMGGASRVEPLHSREGQMWLPQDLQALQLLARHITRQLKPRTTRRWQPDVHGRKLDMRLTLRRSVAWGGALVMPCWKASKTEPPRLFILVDVSRSMESHASLFLRVARAFALEASARIFVFHTSMIEVTPLMQCDSPAVQEKINAVTAGFGAGTRIAASLKAFARRDARAQLGSNARVWVMSDGFDTDEPQELAKALEGLTERGARISWFHPTREVPAAAALQQARHRIERFIPLASLADLKAAAHQLH